LDAFGICAALHVDGRIETTCPDCGEPRPGRALVGRHRVHLDRRGQLSELAHAWSSDRPPPEWQPRTREQNQAVLDRLGLTGPFWRLP